MIVSLFHIKVEADRQREFEAAFAHRAGLIDQMPGFVSLDFLRDVEGTGYVVMTRWQRREDMEAWLRSPAWMQAHRSVRVDPERVQPGVDMYLDVYEVAEG